MSEWFPSVKKNAVAASATPLLVSLADDAGIYWWQLGISGGNSGGISEQSAPISYSKLIASSPER